MDSPWLTGWAQVRYGYGIDRWPRPAKSWVFDLYYHQTHDPGARSADHVAETVKTILRGRARNKIWSVARLNRQAPNRFGFATRELVQRPLPLLDQMGNAKGPGRNLRHTDLGSLIQKRPIVDLNIAYDFARYAFCDSTGIRQLDFHRSNR